MKNKKTSGLDSSVVGLLEKGDSMMKWLVWINYSFFSDLIRTHG